MPPQKHPKSEEDFERDYAIRRLTDGVELLADQVEKNADGLRSVREDVLVLKTKLGFVAAGAGLVGGGLVTLAVRLLTH